MSEVEEYKEQIIEDLKNYDCLVNHTSLNSENLQKWWKECVSLKRQIQKLIETLQDEVRELKMQEVNLYIGSIKSFTKKLRKIENEYEKKLLGKQEKRMMIQNETLTQETKHWILQTIRAGDEAQQKIKTSFKCMCRITSDGEQFAESINQQLNEQINHMTNINERVKGTHSTLRKVQNTIGYFWKAVSCDKVMLGMLILIFLTAIALIVLVVKKNSK